MNTELMYRMAIILSDVAGVIIAYNLFSGFFEDAKGAKKHRIPILAGIIIVLITVNLFIVKPDYYIFVALVVYLLMAAFMFSGKALSKVLVGLFYVVFGGVSELVVGVIAAGILKIPLAEIGENEGIFILGSVTSKLVLYSIVKILLRITSKEKYHLTFKNWLMLLTIPVISIVMCLYIMNVQYYAFATSQGNIISGLGILYLNLVAFALFDSIGNANREAKMAEEKNKQLMLQHERYQGRLVSYKEIRRVKHDIHNHLLVVDRLVENQEYQSARDYLRRIENIVERASDDSVTGNIAIDAIVHSKLAYAKEKGIQTFMDIQVPDTMTIDVVDLSIVLGNALDNAIEASELVPWNVEDGQEPPSIDVMIKYKSGNLLIKVINSIVEKPYKVGEENLFRSSKSGDRGYGLDNVNMVIERYRGNLVVDVIGDYFNFSALIPDGAIKS